jgi:hypothetical protein
MKTRYFSLDSGETHKIVRWIQLFFGILCLATSIAWLILYPGSMKSGLSFWVSFIFLAGFGLFQINAGLGRGRKFIEIGNKKIILKKNSVLPSREIRIEEIENIRIYPLNIVFMLRNKKSIMLRLGTTYTDIISPVKESIIELSTGLNIPVEILKEDL